MNYLLLLMLAYSFVSLGSAVLLMKTTVNHAILNLTSLLYLVIAIGAVLVFINQMLSLPDVGLGSALQ